MNTQPEALRLADLFENYSGYSWEDACSEAAAELRRLQAENEVLKVQRDELLEALEELNSVSARGFLYDDPARVKARKTIASVKGGAV